MDYPLWRNLGISDGGYCYQCLNCKTKFLLYPLWEDTSTVSYEANWEITKYPMEPSPYPKEGIWRYCQFCGVEWEGEQPATKRVRHKLRKLKPHFYWTFNLPTEGSAVVQYFMSGFYPAAVAHFELLQFRIRNKRATVSISHPSKQPPGSRILQHVYLSTREKGPVTKGVELRWPGCSAIKYL